MHSVSRIQLITIALLGFFELFLLIIMLQYYKTPVGQYGFIAAWDGLTIVSVESGKSAALAGIKVGDRINYQSLNTFGRHFLTLKEPVTANTPLSFELMRDGKSRFVTLNAEPMPIGYVKMTTIISGISGFVFAVIGLILIIFRSNRMTWAFALIAPELLLPSYFPFLAQHTESYDGIYYDVFISAISALQMTALLIFSSRFPHNNPKGLAIIIDKFSIHLGIAIAFLYISVAMLLRFSNLQFPYWLIISDSITLLISLAALAALISTMITTEKHNKSRLAPVIVSFTILIILGALEQITQDMSSNYNLLFPISLAYATAPVLVAITVAYGVIRYRVMDIDLILERTLVLSVLTAIIIVCFVILEFFVSKLVEEQVAEIMQMIAAVIIGVSIQYLHLKLDHFVKKFFFRHRYIAKKQLNKAVHAIQHSTSLKSIDTILVNEPFLALNLSSAAIFRRNDNDNYERVAACGWEPHTTILLKQDNYVVRRLITEMKTMNINASVEKMSDFPCGLANQILIIPILLNEKLEAILCYGGHLTGENINADERKSLHNMARAAALTYAQLFQMKLHQEIEKLKLEVDNMQQTNMLLKNVIRLQMNIDYLSQAKHK